MAKLDMKRLDRAVAAMPECFPGPGGVVAVVREGEPVVRHAWGFANLETRQPFTTGTLMPCCSISKQFTCATVLSVTAGFETLDPIISDLLPNLEGGKPTARNLADNQSGLRDYWALTVLCGAMPEGDFRPADALHIIALARSLHFRPGTSYSYSNGNFRALATAVVRQTGQAFGDQLITRVARPAGMESACFIDETSAFPGGAAGYEGSYGTGWRPGVNRIHWTGDAGLTASLDDLVAWERFIDRGRDDPSHIYNRLAVPARFADGAPAAYGLGLMRWRFWNRDANGHSGAIRGWRLQRVWIPSERLSIDVAFNHETDTHEAITHILAAALDEHETAVPLDHARADVFTGDWLDEETGLLLAVRQNHEGLIVANYDGGDEILSAMADGAVQGKVTRLSLSAAGLRLARAGDGIYTLARRVEIERLGESDVAGEYFSDEFESTLTILNSGGSWFAGFSGFLGAGPLMPLIPLGRDLWRMACYRSVDAPAPGEWTVHFTRNGAGLADGLVIGCWLARNVHYRRR